MIYNYIGNIKINSYDYIFNIVRTNDELCGGNKTTF